jgi:hypothetical protein
MIHAGRVPGFVLRRTRTATPAASVTIDSPDELPIRWKPFLLLLILLPLFGEFFHYMKDVRPLWALSKAFPILSLPLCFFVMKDGPAPRGTRQILISMLYLILVPSFAGIFTFQQSFFLGLSSQVKLLPILYFFSFTGLLRILKPTASEIAKSFLWLGVIFFAILIFLWLVVPQDVYMIPYKIGDSPLFSYDSRGNRIRYPFFFGIAGTFYCYRRFFAEKKFVWLLGTLLGFAAVIGIIRGRSTVLGMAVMLAFGAVRFSKPATRVAMLAILPFAAIGLLSVPYVASAFDTSSESGFDVRRISIQKAMDYMGHDPVRWMLGNGSISPFDPGGMMRFFNHYFFLADITWVGITFEFGIIGAALVLLIPARGIWESRYVRPTRAGAFLGSLQDYLLYAIVVSPMYPLTLNPGEFTTILALVVYERTRRGTVDPRFSHL